jgi:Recombination endonuclease VII
MCKRCCADATNARRAAGDRDALLARRRELRRQQAPEDRAAAHRVYHLRRYGLTAEGYDALLAVQGGVCALCRRAAEPVDRRTGAPRRLAVDHCHRTGRVRGLLCTVCNTSLRAPDASDDPGAWLAAAVRYLAA